MKELPINLNPYAKTFQHSALPISALTAENPENKIFMLNNITQVQYFTEHTTIDFYANGIYFDDWECSECRFDQQSDIGNDIIEYIHNSINKGYYVYTFINEMFLPNRFFYLKSYFEHDILIYGYDDKYLFVLGYDETGFLNPSKVSCDEFNKAIESLYTGIERAVISFKSNKNYENEIDIGLNIALIDDYLNSYNSSARHKIYNQFVQDKIWGINAFEMVLNDLIINNTINIKYWDLLYEHKRLMNDRIELFSTITDVSVIQENYKRILNMSSILKMLILKYRTSCNKKILFDVENKMCELIASEKDIINNFINKLKAL